MIRHVIRGALGKIKHGGDRNLNFFWSQRTGEYSRIDDEAGEQKTCFLFETFFFFGKNIKHVSVSPK